MSEEFKLPLVHASEPTQMTGVFSLDAEGYECFLTLRCDLGEFQAKHGNFFDALCSIRAELEPLGWLPVCYGSSLDVYPSNMCRDQGRGMLAYRMEMGREPAQEHLVETFRAEPGLKPATIEQQRQFYEDWRNSLVR